MSVSPLSIGEAVSVAHFAELQQEIVGVILENNPNSLVLKFLERSFASSFNKKDSVRIRFLEKSAFCYWDGEVLGTSSPAGRFLVSRPNKVKVEKRRFRRRSLEIPLSFTVVYAGERRVVAREVYNAKTKVLSSGAVEFETPVSLEQREILELKLNLSESQQVSVMARVARFSKSPEGTPLNSVVVRFLALKSEDHDRLETFLSQK